MTQRYLPTPKTAAQREAMAEADGSRAERLKWTEAEFLAAIRKVAKAHGWKTYHTHDSRKSESGFPDLVLMHPVRCEVLAWELKAMDGKITFEQGQWIVGLNACGIQADVVRPDRYDWIVEILREWEVEARP